MDSYWNCYLNKQNNIHQGLILLVDHILPPRIIRYKKPGLTRLQLNLNTDFKSLIE